MSMIGLFTTAPQAVGTATATDDAGAAAGFGTALQGALAAFAESAGSGVEAKVPAAQEPPADPAEAADSSTLPVAASPGAPIAVLPANPLGVSAHLTTGTAVLVELVEISTGGPISASTASATGAPLVELGAVPPVPNDAPAPGGRAVVGEAPASGPTSASTPSATGAPLVELGAAPPVPNDAPAPGGRAVVGEAPASGPTSASTASATGAPLVELGAAPPVPNDAPASGGRTVGSDTPTDNVVPASASSAPAADETTPTQVPITAPAAVSVAPTAPTAPSAAPSPLASAPFVSQLAKPIFSLAAAGAGEHVMTVSVTPDNLGPVTVRAHVGAEGVRVELFAPNDAGRDAIRAVLTDLRRDLAGAGLGGHLTLSTQNQPSGHAGTGQQASGQPGQGQPGFEGGPADRGTTRDPRDPSHTAVAAAEPEPRRAPQFGTASTIDVLA